MDKFRPFKSTRQVISISQNGGFIHKQVLKFTSSSSSSEELVNREGTRRGMSEASQANLIEGAKPGFGTYSQRNLRKCIDVFFWSCRSSRGTNPVTRKEGFLAASFITLTVPDMHTVIDSKNGYEKLLKEYIKWMIRTFGVKSYIWKFEWQERGQGHWHIFTDRFCDVGIMQKEWIRVLDKCGLIEDWKEKYSYDPIYSCKVKGLKSVKEVREYLWKYMSKTKQNEKETEGRAWGASLWIKKAERMKIPVTEEFQRTFGLACEVGAFEKQEVKIPETNIDGSVVKGIDGLPKERVIGTSFWSKSFEVKWLLCNEQIRWYNAFIRAYQERNWEQTVRLCIDLNKIEKDYKSYTEWKAQHQENWRREEKRVQRTSELQYVKKHKIEGMKELKKMAPVLEFS